MNINLQTAIYQFLLSKAENEPEEGIPQGLTIPDLQALLLQVDLKPNHEEIRNELSNLLKANKINYNQVYSSYYLI